MFKSRVNIWKVLFKTAVLANIALLFQGIRISLSSEHTMEYDGYGKAIIDTGEML